MSGLQPVMDSHRRRWSRDNQCLALELFRAHGYREDIADDDPHKMVIKTHPPTGYPQVYFLDPDRYLFEFNAEMLD